MKSRKTRPPKSVTARTGTQLTRLLGLEKEEAAAVELRVAIVKKIVQEIGRQGLTHAQAAELAGTSRTRMTAVLNGAIHDVSTDLLLRILSSLGFHAKVSFSRAA